MPSVFVLNCGSSSIKCQVIDSSDQVLFGAVAENIQTERCRLHWQIGKKKGLKRLERFDYQEVIGQIVILLKESPKIEKTVVAVGHRIVHGGEEFTKSVIVDEKVLGEMYTRQHLAPLHNPINILGIVVMQELYPKLPHVAVFDTSFHQTLPTHAYLYAIPYVYYKEHKVRRYGFHGLSHRYITEVTAEMLGKRVQECSIVSAHLGNGCSVCAILNGQSVDTSMGFTPLEGLMMGKRSGDIDPAAVAFLADKLDISAKKMVLMLNQMSGLLGVSCVSADLRLVKKAAEEGDELALLAIEMFCYRLAKYIASYFVPLGLPDALVFTGGIGENAPFIRSRVVEWLNPMGFKIEEKLNQKSAKQISPKGHLPQIFIFPTNEELLIAKDSFALVEGM